MGDAGALPDHFVKPTLAAMKGIWPVVHCKLVRPPLQAEDPLGYPVRNPAHHSPKIRAGPVLQIRKIGCSELMSPIPNDDMD